MGKSTADVVWARGVGGSPRHGRGPREASAAPAGHTEVARLAGAEGVGQGLADWKAIRWGGAGWENTWNPRARPETCLGDATGRRLWERRGPLVSHWPPEPQVFFASD